MRLIATLALALILNSCVKAPEKKATTSELIKKYDNSSLIEGEFKFRAPSSWQEIPPSNSMRVKEYIIDPTSQTRLAAYFFPGMKNAVEPNLERWVKQFDPETAEEVQKKQFNQNNVPTTVFEMKGTYLKALKPMDPNTEKIRLENHTMLAAVAETDSGMWFFKTYGQNQVIKNQRAGFDKLVSSFSLEKL